MEKFMSFETFKEEYIDAIASGKDMLCCYWNDDGYQVNMIWKPYTKDIHDQIKYDAEMIVEEKGIEDCDDDYEDALDEAIYEAIESYKTILDEAARKEYRNYIGEDDDEEYDFEFSERFGDWT